MKVSFNILVCFKQIDLDLKISHMSAVRIALEFYLVCCDCFEISDVTEKDY